MWTFDPATVRWRAVSFIWWWICPKTTPSLLPASVFQRSTSHLFAIRTCLGIWSALISCRASSVSMIRKQVGALLTLCKQCCFSWHPSCSRRSMCLKIMVVLTRARWHRCLHERLGSNARSFSAKNVVIVSSSRCLHFFPWTFLHRWSW